MVSMTTPSIFAALKATLPTQTCANFGTKHTTNAMQRLARAPLPSGHLNQFTISPSSSLPFSTKRRAPQIQSALHRVASARLNSSDILPPPSRAMSSTEASTDNASIDDSALQSVAGARPLFQMGCKPVVDTEMETLREKAKEEIRQLKDDVGRGNIAPSDPVDPVKFPTVTDTQRTEQEQRVGNVINMQT